MEVMSLRHMEEGKARKLLAMEQFPNKAHMEQFLNKAHMEEVFWKLLHNGGSRASPRVLITIGIRIL